VKLNLKQKRCVAESVANAIALCCSCSRRNATALYVSRPIFYDRPFWTVVCNGATVSTDTPTTVLGQYQTFHPQLVGN